jgi:hypothetical protein
LGIGKTRPKNFLLQGEKTEQINSESDIDSNDQVNGDAARSNQVSFNFPARTKKATIIYQAYNIDFSSKVNIIVNGNTIGYAGKTKSNK